ncbi:DUF4870 domain-containing protein [Candidatus Sumerlaeota bacterium]|nr:DUF4870 domain-containing protein [Candidatus Sumerlaeota bacterium]
MGSLLAYGPPATGGRASRSVHSRLHGIATQKALPTGANPPILTTEHFANPAKNQGMLTRSRQIDDSLLIVRPEDRLWGLALHALCWIPVWGFISCAIIWLCFKNRSREMIFQVQQAVQFQIVVLLPMVVWIFCGIVIRITSILSPWLGRILEVANNFLLSVVITGCAAVAVAGAAMVYLGRPFLYPVIGRRVLEASIRKFTEE